MSYAAQYLHVVFATKHRQRLLEESFESRLHKYISGVCKNLQSTLIEAGGVEDHLHLLITLPTTISTSELVGKIKANSSRWISSEHLLSRQFAWQDGFSSFTVSRSNVERVRRYIRGQKKHHRKSDYEREISRLLEAHGISPDSVPPLRGSTT